MGGDDVDDGLAVAERVLLWAHVRRGVPGLVKHAEAVAQPLVPAENLVFMLNLKKMRFLRDTRFCKVSYIGIERQ